MQTLVQATRTSVIWVSMTLVMVVIGCSATGGGGGGATVVSNSNSSDPPPPIPGIIQLSAPDVGDSDAQYAWVQSDDSGLFVTLDDATAASPSFEIPEVTVPTTLRFEVTITTPEAIIIMHIEVTVVPLTEVTADRPFLTVPIADAGSFQEIRLGETATLDATGSRDGDGDELTFQWESIEADGAAPISGELLTTDSAIATFVPIHPGTFYFSVRVSDGSFTTMDSVAVRVLPLDPQEPPVIEPPLPPDTIATSPVSTFEDGDEGWIVSGNNVATPTWEADGGRPDGYVWMRDGENNVWYWEAPQKFLGDRSEAFGRTLRYDVSQTENYYPIDGADVILRGNGLELYFIHSYRPYVGWTSYNVALNETAGWRRSSDDELATAAELLDVLGHLDQIRIRGEYNSYGDECGLDNVALDLGTLPIPVRTEPVRSSFEDSDEGWRAIANGNRANSRPVHEPNYGRTGRFISIDDADGNHAIFWDAPEAFLGNVAAAFGGTLSFDLATNETYYAIDGSSVVLRGGGLSIYFNFPYAPYAGWTAFSVELNNTAGWRNSANQELVTEAELLAVLTDLRQILIRGEFYSYGNQCGLDNVALEPAPAASPLKTTNVVSTFEEDDEGWTVIGNSNLGASRPTVYASGGRPDGYIGIDDASGSYTVYWDAPEKYLGNVSSAYGRTLTFDLSQSATYYTIDGADVIMRGRGISLEYVFGEDPYSGWVAFSTALDENSGWRRGDTDELATAEEMMFVLSDLRQILIRGEYFSYADSVGIDNVVLDLGSLPLVPKTTTIRSSFEDGSDGWQAIGNGPVTAGTAVWEPVDGHPDGHITLTDADGSHAWYWDAPAAFLGDISAGYGHFLSFDLLIAEDYYLIETDRDVIIRGGGETLYFALPYLPDVGWTSYSIRLDENSGWRHQFTEELATKDEIRTVLGSMRQILIRGDYYTYGDLGGLDEVTLELE